MGAVTFSVGTETCTGYLAVPESGVGPGVLLLHAWWGLNPFFTELCDRLAAEGFTVFAPDLNLGKIATTIDEAEALMGSRDFPATYHTAVAALDYLRSLPSVSPTPLGVIGFSMGVGWALVLGKERPDAFAAVVLFYGTSDIQPADLPLPSIGHFGEADTWEPIEEVRKMAAENVTLYFYPGVGHWFFEGDRPDNYDAASATLAYERTVAFLKEKLTPAA